ncbi:efflux RND transporter permease subunit [Sulfurimonas sp. HSL3-7]|uniref:efflux RND transporter permease subunit n=1 Tax=Sulfonitrofixus jiaomeiensis TaxID=3131938 RepID=UPI0031FA1C3C
MKSITQIAIEKNRISVAIILFFLIGGVLSYFEMPRAKDPSFVIRTAVVVTQFPGATPERIESLVTIPLERKIRQIEEIDHIKSVSKNGVSTIYVYIQERYKEMAPVWDEIRKKIDEVQLPQEAARPFLNDSYNEVFGTLVTLVGEGYSYAELESIANDVKEELLNIKSIGKVDILGQQKEYIYVEFSNAKLAEVGISPDELGEVIRKRNIITPGGSVTIGPQRLILEPTGNLNSLEELGKTIVPIQGKESVLYLEDIVTIRSGYSEPSDPLTRFNGEQSLVLAISLSEGSNIIELGKAVKAKIAYLETQYPIGVEFKLAFDEPKLVDTIIGNFMDSLIMSIIIVIAVMFVTLGWRTGLIVATLIPTAIATSFFFMWQFNIGLNQVSLAALIISLGLLVDNAIVISESVLVKMDEGFSPLDASIGAVTELKVSLLTSSLTTSAAFLPIYLAESAAGEYISALFEVVTITLVSSWILSLTLTPMMTYLFLQRDSTPKFTYNNPFCNSFKGLLTLSLKYRAFSISVISGIFVLSLILFGSIPKIFFPPSDQPSMLVRIALPLGSDIEETRKTVTEMERYLHEKMPELVKSYTSFIGTGTPRFWINNTPVGDAPEYAEILINATSLDAYEALQPQIEEFGFNHFSTAEVSVKKLDNGPPVKTPVQIRISGNDMTGLRAKANAIKMELSEIYGTKSISDDWDKWAEKLVVNINPSLAHHAGVSYSDIANSLQTALTGREITQYRTDNKVIPIVLRSNHDLNSDLAMLESTLIFVPRTGKSVPLTQVADIDILWKPPKIIRRDGLHTITVSADLIEGVTAFDVKEKLDSWLDAQTWPQGYSYAYGGEIESSDMAQKAVMDKLPIAAMIILVLLMTQFNSLRRTGLILITIPLAIIGVVFGLFITQSYFGFMTYLGVISLTGIVINNAIILIERIEYELTVTKLDPKDAIIEAAQRRMRPIMLTTLTTIGGLLPLWFFGGPLWEPMAIAIIFGLGFATILTLGIVPIFYSIIFGIKYPKEYRFIYLDQCILERK